MTPLSDTVRRRLEMALGRQTTFGNRIDRLRNGDEIFPAMVAAIRGARRTVDFLTFVYWTGEPARAVAEALCERARAGVRVRVILDAFGARHMPDELVDDLRAAGVLVHWFRDVTDDADALDVNHRTHRKVLVVDHSVGFTGGVGIAEEWSGDARTPDEWRDSHFRVEGPAVEGLAAAFLDDWAASDHPLFDSDEPTAPPAEAGDTAILVVTSESERGLSAVAMAKRILIGTAESRIRITTAYFSPDDQLAGWLVDAARRGVAVEVLMPGEHTDKRIPQVSGEAEYADLLDAGVIVRQYDRTMLHAKVMTIDGDIANVGSANFNMRSASQDEEVDLVVFDRALTAQLDADYDEDVVHARVIDPADWQARGVIQRVQEAAVGLIDRWV